MMIDLTGQQFGDYRLVRFLGAGGFASVYLGENVHIPSLKVAIKILHLINVDQALFRREAETMVSLMHPHIVRLLNFAFQQESKMPFLVMDYAPGGSLLTRHPRGTQVPLTTVVQYVKEIALALQYAHDQHILHRDVKPENILIWRDGKLLLSDFGLATLSKTGRTSLQPSYGKEGTPYYMAPEMFRGKLEKASDQYSLSVMVYEWLCGAPPFNGDLPIQLMYQHIEEPVPPLCNILPTLSPRVEAVVLKALAKKPAERSPSVQAFAEALEEASKGPPAPLTPSIGTPLLIYSGHFDAVRALAWSPDGSRIASGSDDKTAQVWEASSGRLLRSYRGHSDSIWTLAWSPDGSRIASGSMGETVQVWEVSSGRLLRSYRGHSGPVWMLAWSPDGSRIASGSRDKTVQVWQAE
nr:serine/threonine-protein kinase [Ktedonobacteraceae bacterium]